ncbi:tonB-dependent receptor [Geoanaerobacter pelophilus]|uniref:TonB-dependent receptor n=1 Tax=Geoanaerobacter pelophilus TaxID=60036 RepID=A0ABQ0MFA3_9BACT|nr:energy transducer TonB [Geoanaerobacter pelophilus]GAW65609.1 tonB-dependent receptor [Geoanaerobacter pelophilus]
MDEVLAPLDEADQPIKPNRQFITGLAVSLTLHLVCAVILVGLPGGGEQPRPQVTYVDLNSIATPRPAAPAAKPAAAEPELPEPDPAKAEPIPVPDTPPAPPQQVEEMQPEAQPAPPQPAPAEERSATTFGMGLTKGYFKSLSDGDSLRPDVKAYYLEVLQGVNNKWWLEQKDQKVRTIVVNISVARNGEIVGSFILQSSGNMVYDRMVQKTLEASGPLPPLPATFHGEVFNAPIRLVPPLNLLAW